jgi:hypothetical protein
MVFPIVAFARLVDHEALLGLCEGGLIETLVFALGTKSVALLDATLELIVAAVRGPLGGRFAAIGIEAGIVEEIEKVVDADDFRCLDETRIPDMVECLLAAIARESDAAESCGNFFLYAMIEKDSMVPARTRGFRDI